MTSTNIEMYHFETMDKITKEKLLMLANEDKPEGTRCVFVRMTATLALEIENGEI